MKAIKSSETRKFPLDEREWTTHSGNGENINVVIAMVSS